MAEALTHSNHRDFWKAVRQMRQVSKTNSSSLTNIDGMEADIASMFSNKIASILNSESDSCLRNDISLKIISSLKSSDLASCNISPSMVDEAVSHLKRGSLMALHYPRNTSSLLLLF